MDKIDDLCRSIAQNVKETVACTIIDLNLGLPLGNYNNSQQKLNEINVISCINILKGKSLCQLEELVLEHRGLKKNQNKFFQEIYVTSLENCILAKVLKGGKIAVMLTASKNANVETTWAQLKLFVPAIEAIVA